MNWSWIVPMIRLHTILMRIRKVYLGVSYSWDKREVFVARVLQEPLSYTNLELVLSTMRVARKEVGTMMEWQRKPSRTMVDTQIRIHSSTRRMECSSN